ncbi:MAG TPA: DUF4157 domain-containing protein [Chitinophaga sp.]|uniref:eCIS core domain-containing protein n=1 Tax=Chitinophaga sp. TaxID=1869181 RepID=UPI002C8AA251|nr:DUF4157 domain-containing protein [Chitinophaga sp.]HVI46339.1 DUF4157 domain-containing protein [Chitinophaga sp.]
MSTRQPVAAARPAAHHSVTPFFNPPASTSDHEPFFSKGQENTIQGKFFSPAPATGRRAANKQGLPDGLRSGIEHLSGLAMDDVNVHYNSGQPARLQAAAYAQGPDIHLGPGQEKHLPHEAWHVVQQKQGRVQPTAQHNGIGINNSPGLENEADIKGEEAMRTDGNSGKLSTVPASSNVAQRVLLTKEDIFNDQLKWAVVKGIANLNGKGGNPQAAAFAQTLDEEGILDLQELLDETFRTQEEFYNEQRNQGLKTLTYERLQKKESLLMEALAIIDISGSEWDVYKTKIKGRTAVGYGGTHKDDASKDKDDKREVKTQIAWKAAHKSGQGMEMEAKVLAPDHPLGSTPGNVLKDITSKLKLATGKEYIAGHLLNNNLGGPADPRNLAAIPKDVNSEMSAKVENKVIERVNKFHNVVYYKVNVSYAEDEIEIVEEQGKGKKVTTTEDVDYAAKFTIKFGIYKADTEDFASPDPDKDVEEMYEYKIPINPPSEYKKTGKKGFNINQQGTGYTRPGKSDYDIPDIENAIDPAIMEFDFGKNIILKTSSQIKLEFLSYAIYKLKIDDLIKKVSRQQRALKDKESETEELKEDLEAMTAKKDSYKEDFKSAQLDNIGLAEKIKNMEAEQEEHEEEVDTLNTDISDLRLTLKDKEIESEELTEKLDEMTSKKEAYKAELKDTQQENVDLKEMIDKLEAQQELNEEDVKALDAALKKQLKKYEILSEQYASSKIESRERAVGIGFQSGVKAVQSGANLKKAALSSSNTMTPESKKQHQVGFREGQRNAESSMKEIEDLKQKNRKLQETLAEKEEELEAKDEELAKQAAQIKQLQEQLKKYEKKSTQNS